MTAYKTGDPVNESALRAALAAARVRVDAAQAEHTAASDAFREATWALADGLRGRWPREDELVYAIGASCQGCHAPMAYWPDQHPKAWLCADVLLGRVGTPHDKALIVERSFLGGPYPDAPAGKTLHDSLPFAFWKVKADPERKTR